MSFDISFSILFLRTNITPRSGVSIYNPIYPRSGRLRYVNSRYASASCLCTKMAERKSEFKKNMKTYEIFFITSLANIPRINHKMTKTTRHQGQEQDISLILPLYLSFLYVQNHIGVFTNCKYARLNVLRLEALAIIFFVLIFYVLRVIA